MSQSKANFAVDFLTRCFALGETIAFIRRERLFADRPLDSITYRRTNMPLLEITLTRQISASIRLEETTATQVDQYAAFLHASADDVIDKALNYVFSKDRDFQDFLTTPQAQQVPATLRIRKPAAVVESLETFVKKPGASSDVAFPERARAV